MRRPKPASSVSHRMTRFYFNEVAPLQASSPVNGVSTQVIMTKAGQ